MNIENRIRYGNKYRKLLCSIRRAERKRLSSCQFEDSPAFYLDEEDIKQLVEKTWKGESALSGEEQDLVLVRWKEQEPFSCHDCILLTRREAQLHKKTRVYSSEFISKVTEILSR